MKPDQVSVPQEFKSTFTTPLRIVLATTAALWMGGLQAQWPSSMAARSASELRFRDFFRVPVGPAGLEISDTLRKADGSAVRMVGYMGRHENPPLGRFLLTPKPVLAGRHAEGEPDALAPATVAVYLDPSQKNRVVPYVDGLVAVSGVMTVGRHEEPDGRVSWARLQLDADATRDMSELEHAGSQRRQLRQL